MIRALRIVARSVGRVVRVCRARVVVGSLAAVLLGVYCGGRATRITAVPPATAVSGTAGQGWRAQATRGTPPVAVGPACGVPVDVAYDPAGAPFDLTSALATATTEVAAASGRPIRMTGPGGLTADQVRVAPPPDAVTILVHWVPGNDRADRNHPAVASRTAARTVRGAIRAAVVSLAADRLTASDAVATLEHEFGHAFGLADVDADGLVMSADVASRAAALAPGDRAGLRALARACPTLTTTSTSTEETR